MSQIPRKRFWEDPKDPPVAIMSRVTLRRTPTITSNTRRTQPVTWGHIKKLSQMVEENLRKAGRAVTMSNLMMNEKNYTFRKRIARKKASAASREVTAHKRPENSLLEETLRCDHAVRMGTGLSSAVFTSVLFLWFPFIGRLGPL
nr:U3 small nucleolar ribonucleoprotein protein MPP10-like isoform X2 [Macaca nemestrina]